MAEYPNTGALFVRQKKNPKAADYGGDVTIDGEVLDYILRQRERGQEVKIVLSGWKRMGRGNTTFISLKVEVPWQERIQASVSQSQQPRQNSNYGNQRGGYGEQSGGRAPIQTSRGQYERSAPRQTQRSFDEDLDDEIPFGNAPSRGRSNDAPWD